MLIVVFDLTFVKVFLFWWVFHLLFPLWNLKIDNFKLIVLKCQKQMPIWGLHAISLNSPLPVTMRLPWLLVVEILFIIKYARTSRFDPTCINWIHYFEWSRYRNFYIGICYRNIFAVLLYIHTGNDFKATRCEKIVTL